MVKKRYSSYGDLQELSNYGTGALYWTADSKDAWGNLTGESWTGGISGAHTAYAGTGQLKRKKWTQAATTLNQLDYGYDSFGNLKTQSSTQFGSTASETYSYDGLQRLTQTTRSGVPGNPVPTTYKYFSNGNLAAKSDYSFGTTGSYVYGGGSCGPHAVRAIARAGTPLTYECDANGNVTGGSALSASYDFNNQPWTINRLNDGSGSAQFAYSANGDVFKTLAGLKSTWFGAGGYEETMIAGTVTKRHELGPITVLRQGGVETVKAVLRDRLGSQVMSLEVVGGGGAIVPSLSTSLNPSLDGVYTISWTATSGASRYELVESKNGAAEVQIQNSAERTWAPPTPKTVGRYTYRVRACAATCGAWSTPLTELRPPNPPTVSTTAPGTTGNFIVSWPSVVGAESYTLEELIPNGVDFIPIASGTTVRSWPLSRATGTYQYRVRACLGVATPVCGNPSTAISVIITGGGDPQTPAAPIMNTPGSGSSGGQISLSWTPAPAPSPQPHYYVMRESFNGGSWSNAVQNGTATLLSRGNGNYAYNIRGCRNNPSNPANPFCGGYSNTVAVTVASSATPAAPASITSSALPGTCVPFNTSTPPAPPTSWYTISWAPSQGAQKYVVRELHQDLGPFEYETSALSRQFDHRKNELPQPRPSYTTFTYEVKACAGSGPTELCSLWTSGTNGAATCVGVFNPVNSPEATPVSTAYDAFGKVRNGDYSDRAGGKLDLLPDTLRGFTGHQHVDDVRLIHMNGRVYDYELGRFLSVDPVIQFPTNTQSLNPYSYILNNPLSGIDPTGYANLVDADVLKKGESTTVNLSDPRSISKVGNYLTIKNEGGGVVSVADRTGATIGAASLGGGNGAVVSGGFKGPGLQLTQNVPNTEAGNSVVNAAQETGSIHGLPPSAHEFMQGAADANMSIGHTQGAASIYLVDSIVAELSNFYASSKGFFTGNYYNGYTEHDLNLDERISAVGQVGFDSLLLGAGYVGKGGLPAQILRNKAAGDGFRDSLAADLRAAGREVETEVYKRTPFGKRFMDIEVSRDGTVLGGIETKYGSSRHTPLQRLKDWWLTNIEGYPVNVARNPK